MFTWSWTGSVCMQNSHYTNVGRLDLVPRGLKSPVSPRLLKILFGLYSSKAGMFFNQLSHGFGNVQQKLIPQ